ncbi:unnamed protein product [Choristocarpus tenellus]
MSLLLAEIKLEQTSISLDPDVTVSVTPTKLMSSGDWVTVSWDGIGWWEPTAYVAAYSPGSALDDEKKLRETSPIKYQYLNAAKTAIQETGEDALEDGISNGLARRMGGTSSLRFRLLNLRDDEGYRFGIFTGGVEAAVLVAATTETVTFAQPYEVLHPHLSLTGVPSSMRLSWTTGKASRAPAVLFRRMTDSIYPDSWSQSTGETITYATEDLCGEPATGVGFHDPGLLHSAVMRGLLPGEFYEYRAGDSAAEVWGSSNFFKSPPAQLPAMGRGIESGSVTVAMFGDMGTAEPDGTLNAGHDMEPPSLQTISLLEQHMSKGVGRHSSGGLGNGRRQDMQQLGHQKEFSSRGSSGLDMVLHIGDLSYSRGYDPQWDEFMDQISPVASVIPWMVGVGNHERDFYSRSKSSARPNLSYFQGDDSGGECGVPTAWRFLMPGPASDPTLDAPWYGFNFGPIHFTVMSTEHDFRTGSEQVRFLEADLAAVNRTLTPWVVFAGHRPMYVSSSGPGSDNCVVTPKTAATAAGIGEGVAPCGHDQPVARLLRSEVEPLLLAHEVDLAVWGHHHSYQRTCKVYAEECRGFSFLDEQGLDGGDGGARGAVPWPRSPMMRGTKSPEPANKFRGREEQGGYVAPVHVVVGMAGMGLSQNLAEPRPKWVEYTNAYEWGVTLLEANATSLHLKFLLDVDGETADDVWLFRRRVQDPSGVSKVK